MTTDELKRKIRQTLTQNPDKKITPAELEDVMIDMVDNQPMQESVIKKELFFDDGSGEVVPVKHPDLSTQPSILPYKFAGNYVYEQMFYIEGVINRDSYIFPLMPADKEIIFLGSSFSGETTEGVIKTHEHEIQIWGDDGAVVNVAPRGSETITDEFKNAWVRLVWTTKPKAGGYYYSAQETKLTFNDNTNGRLIYMSDANGNRYYPVSGKIVIDSKGRELLLQGGWLKWHGSAEANVVYIDHIGDRRYWYKDQPLYLSIPSGGDQTGIALDITLGSAISAFIEGDYAVEIVS